MDAHGFMFHLFFLLTWKVYLICIDVGTCIFVLGDPAVKGFEGTHLVFVAAGSDPFEVITNAVK